MGVQTNSLGMYFFRQGNLASLTKVTFKKQVL